jgi:hypothetical protein
MRLIDLARAAGLAALVLLLDILIAIGVVWLWSALVEPGHPSSYYATAGVPIARWSTRIVGTSLVFATVWWFSRRRPDRNAYLFAVTLVVCYAFLDGASVAFDGFFSAGIALTMLLKLLGGLRGALIARRGHSGSTEALSRRPTVIFTVQ